MSTVEKYLKPEVIRQISRLDLRAQFIVKGFLHGLHASPFHGFSVEFSEHRKYTPGDDPQDIDWLVYAKTDKYYVKKFEAETNITGYLAMDLSESMALHVPAGADEVRVRDLPGGGAVLPDDPPAGPGRPGHVRREDHATACRRRSSGSRSATSCRCWRKLQPAGQTDVGQQPDPARGDAQALAAW